jgi:peptide chain release factor 2
MEVPTFWDNNEAAQKVIADCNLLRAWTLPAKDLKRRFFEVEELLPES